MVNACTCKLSTWSHLLNPWGADTHVPEAVASLGLRVNNATLSVRSFPKGKLKLRRSEELRQTRDVARVLEDER